MWSVKWVTLQPMSASAEVDVEVKWVSEFAPGQARMLREALAGKDVHGPAQEKHACAHAHAHMRARTQGLLRHSIVQRSNHSSGYIR